MSLSVLTTVFEVSGTVSVYELNILIIRFLCLATLGHIKRNKFEPFTRQC